MWLCEAKALLPTCGSWPIAGAGAEKASSAFAVAFGDGAAKASSVVGAGALNATAAVAVEGCSVTAGKGATKAEDLALDDPSAGPAVAVGGAEKS